MTEGGPGGGVGAHFHARHFENFFGFDGETLGWAYGKAVPLHTGDYFQAPPRNLHGFRLNQAYNRFAAFLTPGIFENFFVMMGSRGRGGDGRGASRRPAAKATARGTRSVRRRCARHVQGSADERPRIGRISARRARRRSCRCRRRIRSGRKGVAAALPERAALLAHAQALCGVPISREITPELRRALALKPRAGGFHLSAGARASVSLVVLAAWLTGATTLAAPGARAGDMRDADLRVARRQSTSSSTCICPPSRFAGPFP